MPTISLLIFGNLFLISIIKFSSRYSSASIRNIHSVLKSILSKAQANCFDWLINLFCKIVELKDLDIAIVLSVEYESII